MKAADPVKSLLLHQVSSRTTNRRTQRHCLALFVLSEFHLLVSVEGTARADTCKLLTRTEKNHLVKKTIPKKNTITIIGVYCVCTFFDLQ